ncbi:hypothetical protein ACP70R_029929 [Stipagrostis hirtigluma subsp. patula]
MAWALQIRWQWFKKTRANRPWTDLELPSHPNSLALFAIAVTTQIGNGNNTLLWTDRWLHGCSIDNIARLVFATVPKKIRNKRTVADALNNLDWIHDIQCGLSWDGIRELFRLWDCLLGITLTDQEDIHTWRLDASGQYSSKSAYTAYFFGAVTFEPWHRLWKTWAPAKCKMFLWLAIKNRCWTADRLAKRGLSHPDKCPLCDQEDETIQHLLTTCVVTRQVWFSLFSPLQLAGSVSRMNERSFAGWWRRTMKKVPKQQKKGVNSLIILGSWIIWKHRNACVFEGASPSVTTILSELKDEHSLWCMAGAKKLRGLDLVIASG